MAQQSSFYFTDGTTRTYPSSKHIASKQHVAVYFKSVTSSVWAVIESGLYDLVNNSIVFTDSPDSALYSQIEVRVADTSAELTDSPSDIATVASDIANVNTVATNIGSVNTVSTNIASVTTTSGSIANVNTVAGSITNVNTVGGSIANVNATALNIANVNAVGSDLLEPLSEINTVATDIANVNTVATNIANVNTVATNMLDVNSVASTVVPNIAEILLADTNATTATTQAGLALTSATNAQLRAWEAEAEKMTTDSYATEAENVFVKTYVSNGNGTFTGTNTTEYSSLHWAAKSFASAQDTAVNVSYDNTSSGMSATNVQTAINEIDTRSDTHIPLSGVTAYNLLAGGVTLSNSVVTAGMSTTLYTGNGTTQSVVTGVDMATQWGNSTTETFGGLVWGKSRSNVINHTLVDTVRGVSKQIFTSLTNAEATYLTGYTSFNIDGFSIGVDSIVNTNLATYASWSFQTTHRITGTTNHGKAYTCHYNPFTGFTIVRYEGSGQAGHEIPHHLGRKLGFVTVKNLSAVSDWISTSDTIGIGNILYLNTTAAQAASGAFTGNTETAFTMSGTTNNNTSTNQYIMYGWSNSYFDESNTLIGNYEIGTYQGAGATEVKVPTRGKPTWSMIKRLDSTGNWTINNAPMTNMELLANTNGAEANTSVVQYVSDGLSIGNTGASAADVNAAGGQYLYMVTYDNDSGSGKSKYPRATDTSAININATLPLAKGLDLGGSKVSVVAKNETITGVTLTEGENYVYYYE